MTIQVLLVDDEPAVLEIAQAYLEKNPNIKVDTAQSVREALEMLPIKKYDAIVSDYKMQEASGIDFLKIIRSKGDKIPFIIFTGKGREEVVIEALNCGADSYLQKGGKPDAQYAELANIIQKQVQRSRAEHELDETERRVATIFDTLPGYAFIKDAKGRYIAANKTFCELVGKSLSEIVGKTAHDIFPKDLAEKYEIEDKHSLESGTPLFVEEEIGNESRRFIAAIRKVPLKNEHGEVTGLVGLAFDVSELKEAERALREESHMLSEVFASIQDGLCVLDKDFTILRENPAMERIRPPVNPPAIGQKCYYAYYDGTSRCPDCHTWRAIEKGEVVREKVYRKDPNGITEKWMDIYHFPLMDTESNTVKGVILYLRDVTERKFAEKALEEGDRLVAQVFSSIQDGISILDKDLKIVRVNPAMERWYAHALPIVGKKCYEAYHGRSAPCEKCPTMRTLETGLPEYEVVPLTGANGEVNGWLDLYSFPFKDPKTLEIEGVIEYVRDATDRMKVTEALKCEHQQLLSIFDSIDEVIYIVDPVTHEVLYINQAVRDDLGEIVGKKCYEALQGLDAPCSFCTNDKIMGENAGQPYIWEVQNRITKRWYRCIDRAILWPDGRMVRYEMAIDINELKIAEEQLKQANQKLSILGSVTKHDALNKLTSLLGYVEILLKKADKDESYEYLNRIKESGKSIQRQLEFVAEYYTVGAKGSDWIKLDEAVTKAMSDVNPVGISVRADIDTFEIFADPMLEKVFYNLFDNAIKHGKKVSKINVSAKVHDDGLRIYFEDNGSGVSPDKRKSLFQPRSKEQSGYGLYLSDQILRISGLTIKETGKGGEGARFEILVPAGKYRLKATNSR